LNQEKRLSQFKSYLYTLFFKRTPSNNSRILGIILLILGIICISIPFTFNIKLGLLAALIGLYMIFLIPEKILPEKRIEIKIIVILIAWILLLFFITITLDLEIFFVLNLLGMLIIKELTDKHTTRLFKTKLNIFLFTFLIIFAILVIKRIISI
jgi:hypothetical protein